MSNLRLRLAPINTGLYVNGNSTSANVDFFSARSGRNIGLCLVGNIAVTSGAVPNTSTGIMSNNACWSELAKAIKKAGSQPGIQLSATLPGYNAQRTFFTDNIDAEIERYKKLFDQMSEYDWQTLGNNFIQAIDLSLKHGFDHVQLHAAHGYALSLALDPLINPHRRGLDTLKSILRRLSADIVLKSSLRVSWFTGLPYDKIRQSSIIEVWSPFKSRIELDLSNGYYNLDKRHIYPPYQNGCAPFLDNAIALATEFTDSSFVVAGNIWSPNTLLETIPPNLNISIGRALIADPNYLLYAESDPVHHMLCDDCGECHFYSKGAKSITCPQWSPKNDVVSSDDNCLLPVVS